MEISGSVALVSAANRGLGRAFAPVLADQRSRDVNASLSRDHELIYPPSRNSGTPRSAAPPDPAFVIKAVR